MRRALIALLIAGCSGAPKPPETPVTTSETCGLGPEDHDGFEDADGCLDPDDDRDRILDVDDLCPCHMEDFDGFEDEDGCPDPDNDQDRISDICDLCPNEPETYQGWEDEDGCPDNARVIVESTLIQIVEHIYFLPNRAEIQPASLPIIDAIAATMIGNPHITLVELAGHTANDERRRRRLGQRRADALREALVARGVPAERLVARSYADERPRRPNTDAVGRAGNRRVELQILTQVPPPPPPPVSEPASSPDPRCADPSPRESEPVCDPARGQGQGQGADSNALRRSSSGG